MTFEEVWEIHERNAPAREQLNQYLARQAAEILEKGYGDMSAPLAPDERVHFIKVCPIQKCYWQMIIEVRSGAQTTRLLGTESQERLATEHMATEHPGLTWDEIAEASRNYVGG